MTKCWYTGYLAYQMTLLNIMISASIYYTNKLFHFVYFITAIAFMNIT